MMELYKSGGFDKGWKMSRKAHSLRIRAIGGGGKGETETQGFPRKGRDTETFVSETKGQLTGQSFPIYQGGFKREGVTSLGAATPYQTRLPSRIN